jgi:HTH-type transcriptional regulator / antitoxin HipB
MKILVSTPAQMSEILLSARKAKGFTQAEVARRMGIKQPRLSLLETTATATITLQQMLALFAIYGLELCVQSRDLSETDSLSTTQPEW